MDLKIIPQWTHEHHIVRRYHCPSVLKVQLTFGGWNEQLLQKDYFCSEALREMSPKIVLLWTPQDTTFMFTEYLFCSLFSFLLLVINHSAHAMALNSCLLSPQQEL